MTEDTARTPSIMQVLDQYDEISQRLILHPDGPETDFVIRMMDYLVLREHAANAIKFRDQVRDTCVRAEAAETEVAALTTQLEQEKIYSESTGEHWNESLDQLSLAMARAETAEAQRDELQKRIGYTAVPQDGPCESPPDDTCLTALIEWCSQKYRETGLGDMTYVVIGNFLREMRDTGTAQATECETNERLEEMAKELLEAAVYLKDALDGDQPVFESHWLDPLMGLHGDLLELATGTSVSTTLPTNEPELRAELDAAKRALAEMEKNSARYEWLKKNVIAKHDTVFLAALADPDATIDAALAAKSPLG